MISEQQPMGKFTNKDRKFLVQEPPENRNSNKWGQLLKEKPFYTLLIVFFIGLGLGFILSLIPTGKDNAITKSSDKRLVGKYKFIRPLLECIDQPENEKPTRHITADIKAYIDIQKSNNKITDTAVYYRDLNNGPWFGINASMAFSPASLTKLPLMIAYLKLSESEPGVLNLKIKNGLANTEQSYALEDFVPQDKLGYGKEYTVMDLIYRMITYSDNVAYELLFYNIDNKFYSSVFSDFEINLSNQPEDSAGDDTLTLKEYSSFYRILYNASYLSKDSSEKALRILSYTTFKYGLMAGIPSGVTVSHKFGERYFTSNGERQLHDCGIVYAPKQTYMLCILTRGKDFNDLAQTIGEISSKVYSYANQ